VDIRRGLGGISLVLGLAASDDGDVLVVVTDADEATVDDFFSETGFLLLQLTWNIFDQNEV